MHESGGKGSFAGEVKDPPPESVSRLGFSTYGSIAAALKVMGTPSA
jgi:hypothetical protein